jgi:hypothetical protein
MPNYPSWRNRPVADGETSLPEPDVLQIHGGHTMTLQFKDIAIRCLEQH